MLQNAKSSNSVRNSGSNKISEGEDDGTDDSNTDTGSGSGAFQPVKPRSMGNLSPVASTTKMDESLVVAGLHTDEMAVDSSTPTTTTIERRKKKPYKELTLEEKVQLIRLAEENAGMSQANIAERYSIAKSNVCRILQRKHEYLRAYEWAGFAGSRKRKLRGDPQQHHHHHHHHQQHQQSRGSAKNFNNFQTLKMTNATNCTVSRNHPTNYVELTTSNGKERATNDNRLVVPQRPATIIQRGNIICIYFDIFLR
ncbi:CENP-B N-terminal DNA-binding domain containing protein [Brugia malayi]|uniref:Bm7952 n=3 Tax=Brugia TaxID=6278 RepID=A0A0K0JUA2_BRUMA|nr:CENP-B N-terminal DNA-binding domain containing protein [Brugia malayi]CDQ03215.1 Bm7952 [Brugia malayi]VIO92655.1 CENP-B N-terminal DNA-binding domain containing protein [Brugia malayi]